MKKLVAALVALVLLLGTAGAETYLLADIGEEAEINASEYLDDGAYWEEYLIDGMISVNLGRHAPEDDKTDQARQFLEEVDHAQWLDIDPIGSYPAQRCKFIYGQSDYMQVFNIVFIFTDDWTYYATLSVPADAEDDYAEEIERIIASLSIEDDAEYGAQSYPFGLSDVENYLLLPFETETDTLAELSRMLGANRYTWTESDAAGMLRLTLASDFGSVEVDIENTGDLPLDIVGSTDLPEELLHAQNSYAFRAARWDGGGYPLPCVRDISVGMRMQDAIDAFAGGEVERPSGESDFSELLSYAIPILSDPEEGKPWESAELLLYGNDGVIEYIALFYKSAAQ